MTSRLFLILGIFTATQSAVALHPGTYRAQLSNSTLEAQVRTVDSGTGNLQLMRVIQTEPPMMLSSPDYVVIQKGFWGSLEYGELYTERRFQNQFDFISYKKLLTKLTKIELTRPNGERIIFQKVD